MFFIGDGQSADMKIRELTDMEIYFFAAGEFNEINI